MNCEEWCKCTLSPYVKCPYCKKTPCKELDKHRPNFWIKSGKYDN